jgi:protein CpxP
MKRILIMIALVLGVTVFANAQNKVKKTPEQRAQHQTVKLQKQLKLTADQSVKVKGILLARANKVDSLKKIAANGNKKAFKTQRKAVAQNTDQQLRSVLNANQQKSYEALKAARKEKVTKKAADKV